MYPRASHDHTLRCLQNQLLGGGPTVADVSPMTASVMPGFLASERTSPCELLHAPAEAVSATGDGRVHFSGRDRLRVPTFSAADKRDATVRASAPGRVDVEAAPLARAWLSWHASSQQW